MPGSLQLVLELEVGVELPCQGGLDLREGQAGRCDPEVRNLAVEEDALERDVRVHEDVEHRLADGVQVDVGQGGVGLGIEVHQ